MRKLAAPLFVFALITAALAAPNGSNTMQVNGGLVSGKFNGLVVVNSNTAPAPTPTAGSLLQLVQADATASRLVIDAFAQQSSLGLRRADNTAASPAVIGASGETLGSVAASGYNGSAYLATGSVSFISSEIWSGTANGTTFQIATTKNTTATALAAYRLDGFGHSQTGINGGLPAISSCGSSPSAARGFDTGGEVTEGTTAAGCTITFANAYTTAPWCVVTAQTQQAAFAYTISTSAITVTNTSGNNLKLNWICNGI